MHGISISGPDAGNYSVNVRTRTTANVTPALLMVIANNASRPEGTANPTFVASYQGFVNGETFASSDLTGKPSLTTTAIASSKPGSYPITAGKGTLAAADYTFVFVNGTLTITNVNPKLTAPTNQTAAAAFLVPSAWGHSPIRG